MADDKRPVYIKGLDDPVYFPKSMSTDEISRAIKTKVLPQMWKEQPDKMRMAFTTPEQQQNYARNEAAIKAQEYHDPGFLSTGMTALGEFAMSALPPYHPIEGVKKLVEGYKGGLETGKKNVEEQEKAAIKAFKEGRYGAGLGDTAAAIAHGVGRYHPAYGALTEMSEHGGTAVGHGQLPGQAAAEGAMLFGPDLIEGGVGLGKRAVKAATKSRLTPTLARRRGEFTAPIRRTNIVPGKPGTLSFGQERGIPTIEKGERTLRHVPGAAGPAERFYGHQEADLESQLRESVEKVSPKYVEAGADAAEDVHNEAQGYVRQRKRAADKIYDDVRAAAKGDTQTLLIGRKPVYDPITGRQTGWRPIHGTYEAPLALQPFRAALKSVYEEFETDFKSLSEAEKMANPAYASLRKIMREKDPLTGKLRRYMGAVDLESNISNIKRGLRNKGRQGSLYTPSGRISLKIIDSAEDVISKALDRAQPGTAAKLKQGRNLVRQYHDADDLIQRIIGKKRQAPEKFFEFMTAAQDRHITDLRRLQVLAPNSARTLARTYLEGLIKNSTEQTGRLTGAQKLNNGLQRLGPKTRELWFGKALNRELDDSFRNIVDLMPAEGSPTAWRLPVLQQIEKIGGILGMLAAGNVIAGAHGALVAAGGMVGANILARIMFKEGGPTLVRKVLTLPIGAGLREATRQLSAMAVQAESEERERAGRARAQGGQPFAEEGVSGSSETPTTPFSPSNEEPKRAVVPESAPGGSPFNKPRASGRGGADRQDFSSAYQEFGRIYGVPPSILRSVAIAESNENPAAVGGSGELGIMQFMPATAKSMHVGDRADAYASIRGAAQLLAQLRQKYGNWNDALDAYNQGETAHNRRRARGEGPSSYSQSVLSRVPAEAR